MICVYEGSLHLARRDPLPAFPLAPRLRPCRFRLGPPLDLQTRRFRPDFSSTQAAQGDPQTHADEYGATIGQHRTPRRSDLGDSQGVRFSGISQDPCHLRVGFGELTISAQKIFSTFLKVLSPLVVRVCVKSVLIRGMKPS